MAFNFLTQELAIDLGTANTVIFQNDKIILDEPSIIAKEVKTDTVIAVGNEAQQMEEHTNPRIETIRPLMNGVIADYDAAEQMLSGFIKKATHRKKSLFSPALKIVVGIPGGSTKVDMRSIRDSAEHSGAHELHLIYEPMASALGIGLDVLAPNGNMVVDIGGGTTEIAVITLGGIAESSSIHIAGNEITTDIIDYLGQQHSISIGRTTAENIKFAVGAVINNLPDEIVPEPYIVRGKNVATGHPAEASEVVALSRQSNESLEQLAQGIQQEIAFVKRVSPVRNANYAVSFSVSRELLMAEISIASDIIRKEVGDSPVKMGLSLVDGDMQRIVVIILMPILNKNTYIYQPMY